MTIPACGPRTFTIHALTAGAIVPPMLADGPAKGKYRIDGDALPPHGSRISRADVADYMMQQLNSEEWSRKGVYLSW